MIEVFLLKWYWQMGWYQMRNPLSYVDGLKYSPSYLMENAEQMNFTGVIDINNAGVLSQDLIWEEVLGATQK